MDSDLLEAFKSRVRAVVEADLAREASESEQLVRLTVPVVSRAVQAARIGGRCGRAWLFGSFAWGAPTSRSDVDLLVEQCADPDALAAEIWRACDRPVHVVELETAPATLRDRALGEGVAL